MTEEVKQDNICSNCLEHINKPIVEEMRIGNGICECCKVVKITWVRKEKRLL